MTPIDSAHYPTPTEVVHIWMAQETQTQTISLFLHNLSRFFHAAQYRMLCVREIGNE
jgi:hypothetical protein